METHLKNLFELLSIPSISAQTEHDSDIQKTCDWLTKKLSSLTFNAKTLPTAGHPVVYAENLDAGQEKPTILIYGHYDVQAADPLDEWTSDPFKPEIRANNIYGRGTADDKGQLYTWIAAIEEIITEHKVLPVNIKFLLEGEEEVGSKNLDNFIEENTALLKADVCVISDSHCLSEEQPLIDYGLRGIAYMEVHVKTLSKDVHSGLYGGNVINPANLLAHVISKLKNEEGFITIPGFYENVREISPKERQKLAEFPFGEHEVKEETGATQVVGEEKFTVMERAGARPTLDVNGLWSGYSGEGPKTIIPASAHAKISMRLVPHQTSDEIIKKFTDYVQSLIPEGVELEITCISSGEAAIMDTESTYFKSAEKSYKEIFGKLPLYSLSGGSIPVAASFKRLLQIDSILMGFGLPDDGLHAPNEKLSLTMFEKGIKTTKSFLLGVSK